MFINATVIALGALAGFTIYFGLAASRIRSIGPETRLILSSVAAGILIFLIFDVLNGSWSIVDDSFINAEANGSSLLTPVLYLFVFLFGLGLGSVGLSVYEKRFSSPAEQGSSRAGNAEESSRNSYRLAMMIAIGIGAHNFGEGLAIGQSFSSGAIALASVLVIGFGLHNSTEGFGILGPLVKEPASPRTGFLILAGLIGGGPTFVGTIIGSMWVSPVAQVLFLSFAAGALVYVTLTMYRSIAGMLGRDKLMLGIFIGIVLGFVTDLVVSLGGA